MLMELIGRIKTLSKNFFSPSSLDMTTFHFVSAIIALIAVTYNYYLSITTDNIVDHCDTIYLGICVKDSNVTKRINVYGLETLNNHTTIYSNASNSMSHNSQDSNNATHTNNENNADTPTESCTKIPTENNNNNVIVMEDDIFGQFGYIKLETITKTLQDGLNAATSNPTPFIRNPAPFTRNPAPFTCNLTP
eukprot:217318_1